MEAYRKGYKKEAVKPQEENMLMMFTHMTKGRVRVWTTGTIEVILRGKPAWKKNCSLHDIANIMENNEMISENYQMNLANTSPLLPQIDPNSGNFVFRNENPGARTSRAGIKRGADDFQDGPRGSEKRQRHVDDLGFTINEDGYTEVYTDGACPNNGRDGAKAGVGVWWGDLHEMNLSQSVVGDRHTNNVAEIQAAGLAISQARGAGITRLLVVTDSQFLVNCVEKWMEGWSRNGWRTSTGEEVKNRVDLMALKEVMSYGDVEVRWKHVRGHAGVLGNERADRLAVAGAQRA